MKPEMKVGFVSSVPMLSPSAPSTLRSSRLTHSRRISLVPKRSKAGTSSSPGRSVASSVR